MKQFVKAFFARYRKERKMHQLVNEDYIEEYHGTIEDPSEIVINEEYLKLME